MREHVLLSVLLMVVLLEVMIFAWLIYQEREAAQSKFVGQKVTIQKGHDYDAL